MIKAKFLCKLLTSKINLKVELMLRILTGASTHDASPMPFEAFGQSLTLKHDATLSQISFSRRKKNLYKDSMAKPEVQGTSDENTVVKPEMQGISDEVNVVKSEIQGVSDEDNVIKPEIQGLQQAEKEVLLQEPNQSEPVKLQEGPGNPFVSLLNGLGIVGSGALGALYATSQKEKAALELSIESQVKLYESVWNGTTCMMDRSNLFPNGLALKAKLSI